MSLISVVMFCIMCYFLGLQKGKDTDFFKRLFRKPNEKLQVKSKKKYPSAGTKKIVSFQDYKRKQK